MWVSPLPWGEGNEAWLFKRGCATSDGPPERLYRPYKRQLCMKWKGAVTSNLAIWVVHAGCHIRRHCGVISRRLDDRYECKTF